MTKSYTEGYFDTGKSPGDLLTRRLHSIFVGNFYQYNGTRGRTRTGTLLLAGDFESPVSTNFTTLALRVVTRVLLRERGIIAIQL